MWFTQYGPIGMSSPVSTGVLKFGGGGAPSALGHAPPAWSPRGSAAPRFPTLCKRCASFRTDPSKQPTSSQSTATGGLGGVSRNWVTREVKLFWGKKKETIVRQADGSKGEEKKPTDGESIHIIQLMGRSHSHQGVQVGGGESRPGTQGGQGLERGVARERQRRKVGRKEGRKERGGGGGEKCC